MLEKKSSQSKISFHFPAHVYTCVLFTDILIHICQDLVQSRFFGPSKCPAPITGLTSEYPTCSVCMRVRIDDDCFCYLKEAV